jgi:hypothetical protein
VDAGTTYVYDGDIEGVLDYRLPMAELRAIADDALSRVLGKSQSAEVLDALEALESCSNISRNDRTASSLNIWLKYAALISHPCFSRSLI